MDVRNSNFFMPRILQTDKFIWYPMVDETIAISDPPVCFYIKSEAKATGHFQITTHGLRTNLLLLGSKVEISSSLLCLES